MVSAELKLYYCRLKEMAMSGTRTEALQIEIPGGKIYLKRWTPENTVSEEPIILLHDSLGCVDLWRTFPRLLADNLSRCVIAYDRLGFGKSGPRVEIPSIDFVQEEASDYFPFIKDGLAMNHYLLLGHSVGGAMSIAIAARDPDCRAVVTMSAQAFVEERTVQSIAHAKKMFEQPGQIDRLRKWHGENAEWVLQAWTEVWLSPPFSTWSLRNCIGNVRCPVLAIHGENDEYGSNAFPEFIVNNTGGEAKILLLKDCGHMPHQEKTVEVLGAVKMFLGRVLHDHRKMMGI